MLEILTIILSIYILYGIGRDLLKAIFTPKKFMRDNKPNEDNGIDFIDFD